MVEGPAERGWRIPARISMLSSFSGEASLGLQLLVLTHKPQGMQQVGPKPGLSLSQGGGHVGGERA